MNFDNKVFVYALICSMFDVEFMSKMRKLSELLKNYENCFDFKNAKILFEHENKNYIIDLISDTKSSYELLYILFKIELNGLKKYLLTNLILNCIREFINCAKILLFFILKKMIIFDSVSIIKN